MTPDKFADLVGKIMAGCQVPMSMGVLGTAREPLIELREKLGLAFGWHDAEQAREAVLAWYDTQEEVVPGS